MKKVNLLLLSLTVATLFSSCFFDPQEIEEPILPRPIRHMKGGMYESMTWYRDTIYVLEGIIRIKEGHVLTINPGTTIKGDFETKGTLVISPGAKILADGTIEKPIVFTSSKPAGDRQPGDWGGVYVLGRASVHENAGPLTSFFESLYGGVNDEDNSGTMRYLRIEFAGLYHPAASTKGACLTLAGVGKNTVVDHVMCTYGLEDGFAFLGGKVNTKHLLSYQNLDDDLSFRNGYQGKIQFAFAFRTHEFGDISGSNGIEVTDDCGGNELLITRPVLANTTLIGPKIKNNSVISNEIKAGIEVRCNAKIVFLNSISTGFAYGLFINDNFPGAGMHILNGSSMIENVVLSGVHNWGGNGYGNTYNPHRDRADNLPFTPNNGSAGSALKWMTAFPGSTSNSDNPGQVEPMINWFETASFRNLQLSHWQLLNISIDAPPPHLPDPTSLVLDYARWDNIDDPFFEKVPFIGAFGTEDWTKGWVNWDPENTKYE